MKKPGTMIPLNTQEKSLKGRSFSSRDLSSSMYTSKSIGTSSAIQQLTRSSQGIRNTASAHNLLSLAMAHSAPGRKPPKNRLLEQMSQSARRHGTRHLSITNGSTNDTEVLPFEPKYITPYKTGYECAACDSSLVIQWNQTMDESMEDEMIKFASFFHLNAIPNPIINEDTMNLVYVEEEIWENQYYSIADSTWGQEYVDLVGMSPYSNCEFQPLNEIYEPCTIGDTSYWVDEWSPDLLQPNCDEEGWLYAVSFTILNDPNEKKSNENSKRARRRRLIRHRTILHSEKSWLNELKYRSIQNSILKTPLCHTCDQNFERILKDELIRLKEDERMYDAYVLQVEEEKIIPKIKIKTTKINPLENNIDLDIMSLEQLYHEENELLKLIHEMEIIEKQYYENRKLIWNCAYEFQNIQEKTFQQASSIQLLHEYTKEECGSVDIFNVHASDMLRCLQRYNVFNDSFHIWHDGSFGTINGLRLGRLPSKPVEWYEINAALGQVTLLLFTVSQRVSLEFTKNLLIPRGSYSKIAIVHGKERKKEYPLFIDGSLFQRQKFNSALICLLECVEEAGKRAMYEEPSLRFPYKITRGKIGDLNISVGGNDEQWTRALKYLLTHLKWLLAWTAKRYP